MLLPLLCTELKNYIYKIINCRRSCKKLIISIMETCVLIPQEFSLCVRGPAGLAGARRTESEPEVSVWSNTTIAQGSLCYPFQGTIRIDKLDVYGQLDDDDVSCFSFFSALYPRYKHEIIKLNWKLCFGQINISKYYLPVLNLSIFVRVVQGLFNRWRNSGVYIIICKVRSF